MLNNTDVDLNIFLKYNIFLNFPKKLFIFIKCILPKEVNNFHRFIDNYVSVRKSVDDD